MRKNRIITAILLLTLIACIFTACKPTPDDVNNIPDGVSPAPDAPAPAAPTTPEAPTPDEGQDGEQVVRARLGVWWWADGIDDENLCDECLDFAAINGVTEIYFSFAKFNEKTEEFIKKANDKNIVVFWLAGRYQWVEDPAPLAEQMQKFLAYQNSHEYKFEGVHFDIEPHQHKNFKTARAELLTKYVELVYSLKHDYPELNIEYDIPFWFEDVVTVNGIEKPVFAHVIDCASRVTLMSYRDTAEKIYSVSAAEIEYAESVGKRLNLGVNTKSTEGDMVSFQEEGRLRMYEEISRLRPMLPADYGVVIHHMKAWYELPDVVK